MRIINSDVIESEKVTFTKEEMLIKWLKDHPEDGDHPDLKQRAFAGYVQLHETGNFIRFKDWEWNFVHK